MAFLAGETVTAGELGLATTRVVARGRRASNSTATATEVGVLRIDDVVLTSGHLYAVEVCNIILSSTVTTDTAVVNIRYTTDGSTPSTASTNMGFLRGPVGNPNASHGLIRFYPASSADTLSLLLTVGRAAGTGNVSITANGTVNPLDMILWDLGDDPGDTGVDI